MKHRYLIAVLGLAMCGLALANGGWGAFLLWPGADFLLLGAAHWLGWHGLFGKRPDGTLPLWSRLAFAPLLAMTHLLWWLLVLFDRSDRSNEVTERLVIGRRPLPGELDDSFDHIIDLTAEFSEAAEVRCRRSYRNVPILDGCAPPVEVLREAVESLTTGRIFGHCAQGHGRTGLFAAALLLSTGDAASVEEALERVTTARPGIQLNPRQLLCLRRYAAEQGRPGNSVET